MKLARSTEPQPAEVLGRRGPFSSLFHRRHPVFRGVRAFSTTSPEAGVGVARLPASSSVTRADFLEPLPPGATAGLIREESSFDSILRKTKAIRGRRGSFTRLVDLMVFVLCRSWCDGTARCTGPLRPAGLMEPELSLC